MEWRRGGQQMIGSDTRLPESLAATLAPPTQKALDHPLRRQILRVLNDSEEPLSPGEIATAVLPEVSQSAISYHAQVLAACGCTRVVGARQVTGGVAPRYASTASDDPQVITVLQATQHIDQVQPA